MSRGHSALQGDQLTGWHGRDHQEHPEETPLRGLAVARVAQLKSLFHHEDKKKKKKRRL